MFYEWMGWLHAIATERLRDDRGQGTVEYIGLMLLVAVIIGAAWKATNGRELADTIFDKINNAVKGVGEGK